MFFVPLNVTGSVDSSTLGLQYDLHKFDAIRKKKKGKGLSLTSARVPTSPTDGVSWRMVHTKHKFKVLGFQDVKQTRKRLM